MLLRIQMPLRINSVLGLMKHITSKVKTVKEGAHLVGPFSILSRRKSRLPPRFRLGLALIRQLEFQHGLLKSSSNPPCFSSLSV